MSPDEAEDLYDENLYGDGTRRVSLLGTAASRWLTRSATCVLSLVCAGPELPLLRFGFEDDELVVLAEELPDVVAVQVEFEDRKQTAGQVPDDNAADATAAPAAAGAKPYDWLRPYREQASTSPSGELHRIDTVDSTCAVPWRTMA